MHPELPMLRTLRAVLPILAVVLLAGVAAAQTGPQPPLPTTRLTAGMHIITAELATTPQKRTVGMMFREQVAPNHGMLFVFESKGQQCFWMRNTPLPLSIAFIADDGTILQITDMSPKSDALHCSQRPVRFALEMEQGWFVRKGAQVGSKLGGLPAGR
jgi:uncharacterized membrane protein (UPF0127 family)